MERVDNGCFRHQILPFRFPEREEVKWHPPPPGFVRVDVDGSWREGQASCGGVIRDENGNWVRGFQQKLEFTSSPTAAAIHAICTGLQLCQQLGIDKIKLYTYSLDTMQLLLLYSLAHPLGQTIQDLRVLIFSNWDLELIYSHRKTLSCAESLAWKAHMLTQDYTVLSEPPGFCLEQLGLDRGDDVCIKASSSSCNIPDPCSACKILRRRCGPKCILAPYFPPEEPQKFTWVHRIFGISNVIKLLQELPAYQREDAVNSLVYEAKARIRDPVNGLVGAISGLPRSQYDVFLSFRGQDTRASFTSHLHSSLSNAGILVFKDDADLPRGNHISVELLRGIEGAAISIIIFSKDYAGSKWCLNELSKIMELHRALGKVVLPVFYGVDPSEVRNQISSFGDAFQDLIQRISPTQDEVLRWRTNLREAGGIAGLVVLNSRNESEDIKNILERVCEILDKKDLFVANHPVGVNSRIEDLIRMSERHPPNDVLLLGIWGMGGIGKTVIAKAIYNKIGRNFESRTFLSNVREVWEQECGSVNLQQQLLSEICKTTKMKIKCVESGKNILKERLCQKQALVVLDDVDKVEQLNALFGNGKWFGPGSRIIITTRDEHLLRFLKVDVDHVYRMKNMDERESIELFSWHAFRQPSPREGFVELSRNVVAYSGGLPLALEVLGCYLFDREEIEWKSVLNKLRKIPNDHIQKKLKISFEGLNDDIEREIFLDISSFFIGMDRHNVTQILNASGFHADIGISALVERSLITIDEKNKLGMHDLLRDMGREIIRDKPPKAFGKRSRLWFHEDVVDVLSKQTGTESIEGLALNLSSRDDKVSFLTKAFKKMKILRLLRLANVELDGDYKYISRDLKWLCWHKFPLKYIPANLLQNNLVAIELKYSNLRLWREPQLLENLKILNLSHSHYFVRTPDFSKVPNLEKLILKDCPSLSMIHHTIGHLDKIHLINLKDCTGLQGLPRSIYKLKCLNTLILSGCLMIEKLEEDIEQMDSLTTLIADNTSITQVPISLVRSKGIGYISICGYQGLARHVFPSLIWSRMSPTNNPLSLILTYTIKPSLMSLDILNGNIPGPSSIYDNLPKPQSLLMDCTSEHSSEVNQAATKILDSLCVASCRDMATTPNTLRMLEIESSMLADHHSQAGISRANESLRHLLIHIGNIDQVTNAISECILQGLTLREYGDDCVLPGDKYPYWQCFKAEGSSVKLKVPLLSNCGLRGMTLCCEYYPSGDLGNMEFDSFISMLIINYTKMTTLQYGRDTMTSLEEAKWKEIISNLDYDDQVEIIVVIGHGIIVKRTAVYLKHYESFDEQKEDPPSSSLEMHRDDTNHDLNPSEPKRRKTE